MTDRCSWKGCRKKYGFTMLLYALKKVDKKQGLDVGSLIDSVHLCDEHAELMGYDAGFPCKDTTPQIKCWWKRCRRDQHAVMKLYQGKQDSFIQIQIREARMCAEHIDAMGYTAGFPRKEA